MGNCCKVVKKEKRSSRPSTSEKHEKPETIRPTVETGTVNTEDRGHRPKRLKILCDCPEFEIKIHYRPAIPIQDLKEQILSEYPDLEIEKYILLKDNFQISDSTATLKQLGIQAGDRITLKLSYEEVSEEPVASENNSIADPRGDFFCKNVCGGKKGLSARNYGESTLTSPKKSTQELWRTALPSPPSRHLIKCDPLDASSFTNNTHEISMKAPNSGFHVEIPHGLQVSDDSCNEENKYQKDAVYFQDLKGPFYMFQKTDV